jgi:hypothetical protein
VACDSCDVGCLWSGRRKSLSEHLSSCVFTYLRPLLQEHASRLTALELENKSLRRKFDMFMRTRTMSDRNDSGDSTALDDQTIQIMTEQEHIRSDLERLFATMADIEIKQSMLTMHMTDNMRTREELAMVGTAVNNLRSQLHGLQLLTLRQQAGGNSSSGPSNTSSHSTVSSMLPVRRISGKPICSSESVVVPVPDLAIQIPGCQMIASSFNRYIFDMACSLSHMGGVFRCPGVLFGRYLGMRVWPVICFEYLYLNTCSVYYWHEPPCSVMVTMQIAATSRCLMALRSHTRKKLSLLEAATILVLHHGNFCRRVNSWKR